MWRFVVAKVHFGDMTLIFTSNSMLYLTCDINMSYIVHFQEGGHILQNACTSTINKASHVIAYKIFKEQIT